MAGHPEPADNRDIGPVLGIDFGTSKICCALWMNGSTKLVRIGSDETALPTYMGKNQKEWLIGKEARDLSTINADACMFNMNLFLGKTPGEAADIARKYHFPLVFCENEKGELSFVLNFMNKGTTEPEKYPVKMAFYRLLMRAKDQAEFMIGGQKIVKCAINTPTSWPDLTCPDIEWAMINAGFKDNFLCVREQDAAMAGCLDQSISSHITKDVQHFVLVDVGVTETRISFFTVEPNTRVSHQFGPTIGTEVGGQWFDQRLMEHCVKQFYALYPNTDLLNDTLALHRLRLACEEAKVKLSTAKWYDFNLPGLHQRSDFNDHLTLKTFEGLCGPGIQEIVRVISYPMREFGKNATNPKKRIRLLLVGGGSRLPSLRHLIQWAHPEIFDKSVAGYAREATAYGVASLAASHFKSYLQKQPTYEAQSKAIDHASTSYSDGTNYHQGVPTHGTNIPPLQNPIGSDGQNYHQQQSSADGTHSRVANSNFNSRLGTLHHGASVNGTDSSPKQFQFGPYGSHKSNSAS